MGIIFLKSLKKQEKQFMKKQVEDWVFIEYAKEIKAIISNELKSEPLVNPVSS